MSRDRGDARNDILRPTPARLRLVQGVKIVAEL
jgi:hypothetical protein